MRPSRVVIDMVLRSRLLLAIRTDKANNIKSSSQLLRTLHSLNRIAF